MRTPVRCFSSNVAATGRPLRLDNRGVAIDSGQLGLSIWFMRLDDQDSAGLFLKAFKLYPDDERMAAAQVRGPMLQKRRRGGAQPGNPPLSGSRTLSRSG